VNHPPRCPEQQPHKEWISSPPGRPPRTGGTRTSRLFSRLGDDCPSSALYGSAGSGQVGLGGVSVCGVVRSSTDWWNDRQNDHLSKQRGPRATFQLVRPRQIRRLVPDVDCVGSRQFCSAEVGCLVGHVRSRRDPSASPDDQRDQARILGVVTTSNNARRHLERVDWVPRGEVDLGC
jgi:hypothetical protein